MPEITAGDRYRLEVRRGSVFAGLFKLNRKRVAAVLSIVDLRGQPVWTRSVQTMDEAHRLTSLVHDQVFRAPLDAFEHWLRTEGATQDA